MNFHSFVLFIVMLFPLAGFAYVPELDVVYDNVDGVKLQFDIFRSSKKILSAAPALVYVHGGCFNMGSRKDISEDIKRLADDGFVIFSVEYRLATKALYPAAIRDVQSAVRFIRQNSEKLGVDPEKIFAHGESAGGTLAAILGLRLLRDRDGHVDEFSQPVAFVSDWYGRIDFTATQSTGTDCAEVFLGKKRTAETMEEFRQASPTTIILKKTAKFLIIHGSRDQQVYPVHSTKLANRLERSGNKSELYFYEGEGHGFSRPLPWDLTRSELLKAAGLPGTARNKFRKIPYVIRERSPLKGVFDLEVVFGNKDRVPVILNGTERDFIGSVGVIAKDQSAHLELKVKDPAERDLLELEQ